MRTTNYFLLITFCFLFLNCNDSNNDDSKNSEKSINPPQITLFELTSDSITDNLIVSFDLTAKAGDSGFIDSYLITETDEIPSPYDWELVKGKWLKEKPDSYKLEPRVFANENIFLYAWVKDELDNISDCKSIQLIYNDLVAPEIEYIILYPHNAVTAESTLFVNYEIISIDNTEDLMWKSTYSDDGWEDTSTYCDPNTTGWSDKNIYTLACVDGDRLKYITTCVKDNSGNIDSKIVYEMCHAERISPLYVDY